MRIPDRIAEAILVGIVLLAPLPLGSVHPAALLVLAGAAIVVCCCALPVRGIAGANGALALAAAWIALLGLALVPLPAAVVHVLSSGTADLRLWIPGFDPTGWGPVSIHPEATSSALARLIVSGSLFAAAAAVARARGSAGPLLAAIVASGIFQALYGSFEHLSGRRHVFGYAKRYYLDDATGTFVNKNHFAGLLEMALPIALGLLLVRLGRAEAEGRSRRTSPRRWPGLLAREDGGRTLLLALGVAVLALGLMLSHSRSGLIGALVGCGIVTLCAARREGSSRVRGRVLIAASALAILVGAAGLERVLMGPSRLVAGLSLERGRFPVWRDSLGIVREFPLFGTGLGTFRDIYPVHRTEPGGFAYDHAHNDLLQLLVETGILGTGLAIIGTILLVRALLRGLRGRLTPDFLVLVGGAAGAAALLLHEITDFNLKIPANAAVFAALVGGMVGALSRGSRGLAVVGGFAAGGDLRRGDASRRSRAAAILVIGALALALVRLLAETRGTVLLAEARAALTDARGPSEAERAGAVASLLRAIAWRSVSAEARPLLALEQARAGDGRGSLVESLSLVGAGLEENPTETTAWLAGYRLAVLGDQTGRLSSWGGVGAGVLAERFLEGAIRSDPRSGHNRRRIAAALMAAGNPARALVEYGHAMADPSVDGRALLGEMLRSGIPARAAIDAMPQEFERVYDAAIHLVESGDADGAEEAFLRAARLDRGAHRPWVSLSRLVDARGDHGKALAYAQTGLETVAPLSPDGRAELLFCSAAARAALGERAGALREGEEALRLSPMLAPLRDLVGRTKLAAGDTQGAIEEWRYILERQRGDPWLAANEARIHASLAAGYEAQGLRSAALAEYLAALRLAPTDAASLEGVARLKAEE